MPDNLQTEQFQFEILEPSVTELDYQAVMSSRERLRGLFGETSEWPRDSLTLESNTEDLKRHETEFKQRIAFAYCVFSPDRSRYIGCVYIESTAAVGYDCRVYLWVSDSEINLDQCLLTAVKNWLRDSWPFKRVAFPGREISWADWSDFRG